ncbi:BQ2448_7228 [Microbotryum intermedium]|uniref:BQ2448_7228 protein n=1 Tax=Microbotryum intermedium TaxID=269621 RepID=A0A238FHL6_9BASI|nr:BQ2448_7228 [Microbotryum intermedium]
MLLSDWGTPVGWRHMDGFGCHTFSLVNKDNQITFVKFHWISQQGTKNMATKICGEDPDYAKRDLWEHIEKRGDARWTFAIQTMTPQQASDAAFDPFDVTKIWPHKEFPLQDVGELVLNRNPEDYHRDVEQACFSPGSFVPGIQTSPDALLNWRAFFYRDAQIHRMGSANIHQVNPRQLPFHVDEPLARQLCCTMRTDGNTLGKPTYVPNSYHSMTPQKGTTPAFDPKQAEAPMQLASNVLSRKSHYRHEGQPSEYDQVRELYLRVMNEGERKNLHSNTGRLLKYAPDLIKKNYLIQLYAIDPEYAHGVWNALPPEPLPDFTLDDVAKAAPRAHLVGKHPDFMLKDTGATFMGMPVGGGPYATGTSA